MDLLPGQTVTVGKLKGSPDWQPSGPILDPAALSSEDLAAALRDYGVEVMLAEYLDEAIPWLEVASTIGARFFAHAHGYDVSERLREAGWRKAYAALGAATGIITITRISRARLIDVGFEPSRVYVVPYGVDIPDRPWVRPDSATIRLLAVGRMVSKKAPILMLEAFRLAHQVLPALRLDYVGDGPLLPSVRQFVHALGLDDVVTLWRGQTNSVVLNLMRQADGFVQHSMADPDTGDAEGLPVAILEAMAQALPVVSTYHEGIPEAIDHGVEGFLAAEGDVKGMAECMVLLSRDRELRCRVGRAGWRRAGTHFSWPLQRARLLQVLDLPAPLTGALAPASSPHETSPATCGDDAPPSGARVALSSPFVAHGPTMAVSIVIPCRRPGRWFPDLLASVRGQRTLEPTEIVLVDNGGGADLASRVAALPGALPVRLVRAPERANGSYARNVGVRAARGDKLLFVDADDELAEGYVVAMSAALDAHDFVAARVDAESLNPEWLQLVHGDPWEGIATYFDFLPATGVNIGIRRELFDAVGGFPEDLPASQDIAFSWRVHLSGCPVHSVQEAVYRYRYRESLSSLYRQCRNWGYSNVMLYTKFRHLGMPGRTLDASLREWRGVLVALLHARRRKDFASLAARTGYCVGRAHGSLRHRVLYL